MSKDIRDLAIRHLTTSVLSSLRAAEKPPILLNSTQMTICIPWRITVWIVRDEMHREQMVHIRIPWQQAAVH